MVEFSIDVIPLPRHCRLHSLAFLTRTKVKVLQSTYKTISSTTSWMKVECGLIRWVPREMHTSLRTATSWTRRVRKVGARLWRPWSVSAEAVWLLPMSDWDAKFVRGQSVYPLSVSNCIDSSKSVDHWIYSKGVSKFWAQSNVIIIHVHLTTRSFVIHHSDVRVQLRRVFA